MTPPLESADLLIIGIGDLKLQMSMYSTYIDIITLPCTEVEATK